MVAAASAADGGGLPVSLVEGSVDTDAAAAAAAAAAAVQTPSHSQEPLRSFSPPPETWSTWSIVLISCSGVLEFTKQLIC